MRSGNIRSGTDKCPSRRDVFAALLKSLVDRGNGSSWAHFEVVADRGWFRNLLFGKEPWIEVAFNNANSVVLNPGIPRSKRALMPRVPDKWVKEGKRMWIVPLSNRDELIDWMGKCLLAVTENPNHQITGWLDGI
jgi:hypothetical protein